MTAAQSCPLHRYPENAENEKREKANDEALKQIRDTADEAKTEMLAGFKVQGDRLNTLDRRSTAIYGPSRDVDSLCLAADTNRFPAK